jgi:hypothetical protein
MHRRARSLSPWENHLNKAAQQIQAIDWNQHIQDIIDHTLSKGKQ